MNFYVGPADADPQNPDNWQPLGWIDADSLTNDPSYERAVVIDSETPAPRPSFIHPEEPFWWLVIPSFLLRRRRARDWQAAKSDHARRIQEWEDAERVMKTRTVIPRALITPTGEEGRFTINALPDLRPEAIRLVHGPDTEQETTR